MLGLDETAFLAATATSSTRCVTGLVDLQPADGGPAWLLAVVEGRSGQVVANWLADRGQDWCDRVQVAALDPFCWVSGCLCGSGQPGRYRAARRRRLGSPFRWPLRGAC